MVRSGGPVRPKKKRSTQDQQPESVEEFQEAADFEEETGGKWRAGDQAKSGRAFLRAIDVYNQGLTRHPKSFDLAYNKARLELELLQQPELLAKLPISKTQLLRQTIDSHRYALRIDEQNPDALFNTAQAIITLAESVNESGSEQELSKGDVVAMLREALELLDACYSRQQMLLEEQNSAFNAGQTPTSSTSPKSMPQTTDANRAEESATIEHPVTQADILDTARTMLNALTLLVTLDNPTNLQSLSQLAQNLYTNRIPQCYSELPDDQQALLVQDIALERVSFIASLATAEYSAEVIGIETYLSRLQLFETLDISTNIGNISTYADGLVDLVTSMQTSPPPQGNMSAHRLAWQQLTKAQELYGRGTKIDTSDARERMGPLYESRGDVELLRYRIILEARDVISPNWRSTAALLIKNAQTYYRGAVTIFLKAQDAATADKVEIRANVAAVAQGLLNGQTADQLAATKTSMEKRASVLAVVTDMEDEGLLWDGWDRMDQVEWLQGSSQ